MDRIRLDAKSLIMMLVQVNKLCWYLISFLRFGQNRVLAIHCLTLGSCCLATSICFCFCQEPTKECQPSVCKTKLKPSSMNQHKVLGSGPGTEVLGSPLWVLSSLYPVQVKVCVSARLWLTVQETSRGERVFPSLSRLI